MILGVSGPNSAGKGEVVTYLEARSFYPLSLSDAIRDELRRQGVEETRERMIETGRALRAEHGPGVLAARLVAKMQPDRNYVIDSIRHPAEVEALRALGGKFQLLWVDADPALRFERMRARGRPGDPDSLEQLLALEGRERGSEDVAMQQLDAVAQLADVELRNDGDRAGLHEQVQRVLEASLGFVRPGWDAYFLSIAQVVASRSNCVKRHVGAVIARDRRIVSTGYNGTPRGVRNCNEGGCPRCNGFAESGTRLDECLCSHGEENAIIQAAYHGVSVRDGSLYTTFFPCLFCTKLIINAGLSEVVYNAAYHLDTRAESLLGEAGVVVRHAPLPTPFLDGGAVEEGGEAAGGVGADHELLEDADALAAAHARAAQLLDVQVAGIERIPIGKVPGLAGHGLLSLPDAMAPLGMQVAETEHLEGQDRLEHEFPRLAAGARQRELRARGAPRAGLPLDPVANVRQQLDTARVHGVAVRREPRDHDAVLMPAQAGGILVDREVRTAVGELQRRPQPEELRGGRHGSGRALADRPHAPGAIAAAEHRIRG